MIRVIASLAAILASLTLAGCYSYTPPPQETWYVNPAAASTGIDFAKGRLLGCWMVSAKKTPAFSQKSRVEKGLWKEGENCHIHYNLRGEGWEHEPSGGDYSFTYSQPREDIFTIHAKASGKTQIDQGQFERFILTVTTVLGRHNIYKYGVFDLASENVQSDAGQTVTETTGDRQANRIISSYGGITFGHTTGTGGSRTTTRREGQFVIMERKHNIQFFRSKPDVDEYFDLDLLAKSIGADKYVARGL